MPYQRICMGIHIICEPCDLLTKALEHFTVKSDDIFSDRKLITQNLQGDEITLNLMVIIFSSEPSKSLRYALHQAGVILFAYDKGQSDSLDKIRSIITKYSFEIKDTTLILTKNKDISILGVNTSQKQILDLEGKTLADELGGIYHTMEKNDTEYLTHLIKARAVHYLKKIMIRLQKSGASILGVSV